nr:unnamed protein product [Digitaria exilis]
MAGNDIYGGNVSPVASDAESPQLVSTVDELIALVRAAPPPAPGVGPFTFQFMLTLHALELGDGDGVVAADAAAMAALPERTVGQGEAREEAECAVCLDGYEAGDALRTMPCSHSFHERCIFQWLRVSRICPLCRFAMPAAGAETESLMGEEEDNYDDGDGDTIVASN